MTAMAFLFTILFSLNAHAQSLPETISIGECVFSSPKLYYGTTYSYSVKPRGGCKLYADSPYLVSRGFFEITDLTFPSAAEVIPFKHKSGYIFRRLSFYSDAADIKEGAVAQLSENHCGIKAGERSYVIFRKGDEMNPRKVSDLPESIFIDGQEVAFKHEDIAFVVHNGKTFLAKSIYRSVMGDCEKTPENCYAVAEWKCK